MTRAAPRVVYYDTLGDDYRDGIVCRDIGIFERFWRGVYDARFRICLKPAERYLEYFPRFCQLAWECQDLIVVVDEVHLFGGNYCCQEFTRLITAGGHRNIELLGATQSPKRLGELFRSQATCWHVFKLLEPRHIDYLCERLAGVSAAAICGLERYDYLHYEDGESCYWRCRDDDASGVVAASKEAIPYDTQTPISPGGANPGQHPDAGGPMGG
jgi:hypothetical protein